MPRPDPTSEDIKRYNKAVEAIRSSKAVDTKRWREYMQSSVRADFRVYDVFAYISKFKLPYDKQEALTEAMEEWLDKHAPKEYWPIDPPPAKRPPSK